jgi:hypothetical protein
VDALTDPALTRRPTGGVAVYQEIIGHGGVSDDYRLARRAALCSLVDPPGSCPAPLDPDGPRARLGGPAADRASPLRRAHPRRNRFSIMRTGRHWAAARSDRFCRALVER